MRFFDEESTDFSWNNSDSRNESQIKRSINKMFLHPLENYPYTFGFCFKKQERAAKAKATSLTQSQLQSSSEDEVEPVTKRLRSSGPVPENAVPPTSVDRSFCSNASDLWDSSAAPLDELNTESLDMRGYSTVKGNYSAHSILFGLLMRGGRASDIYETMFRLAERVQEFRSSEVLTRRSIENKRSDIFIKS